MESFPKLLVFFIFINMEFVDLHTINYFDYNCYFHYYLLATMKDYFIKKISILKLNYYIIFINKTANISSMAKY